MSVGDRALTNVHPGEPAPRGHQALEGHPFVDLHPGVGQGHRVGQDVPGRMDVTVLVEEGPAAGRPRGQGRVEGVGLVGVDPAHPEPETLLHGQPRPGRGLVALAEGGNEIALLHEPGVDPQLLLLALVEGPRPFGQPHGGGRPALAADDPGGPAAGPLAQGAPVDEHDPSGPALLEEIGAPAADGPAPHHHGIGPRACPLSGRFPRPRR